MADRLSQISGHLSNTYSKGLLAGKTAIITGSGQGIGAECARLFANEGARVVVCDIDAKKAEDIVSGITKSGGTAIAYAGDVQTQEFSDGVVKAAAALGGDDKIHILVLMAGFTWGLSAPKDISPLAHKRKRGQLCTVFLLISKADWKLKMRQRNKDGVIHKMTDKQWDAMLAIHNTGPFRLVRAAAPYFRLTDGEDRSVINISSTSGVYGNAGQINYAVAKAGVTGMAKTIAKEWGPKFGVRANTVAYGRIETRLTQAKEQDAFAIHNGEKIQLGIPGVDPKAVAKDIPLGRGGTATEAAGAVLALASPLMAYVTGHTLMVTGGR